MPGAPGGRFPGSIRILLIRPDLASGLFFGGAPPEAASRGRLALGAGKWRPGPRDLTPLPQDG